jgi:hypothetical protein
MREMGETRRIYKILKGTDHLGDIRIGWKIEVDV